MEVLLINGSSHREGNCASALSLVGELLIREGIETKRYSVSDFLPNGCNACGGCRGGGGCIFGDISELSERFRHSSGIIVAAPVFYGSPSGSVISLLDRLFQSSKFDKRMKVGASIVSARRGGCTASFDVINKYFSISEMPIATSNYWNMIHTGGDGEGVETLRRLSKNFAALVHAIHSVRE